MQNHLDLSNFHAMTGNDTDLEKMLFDEYISSSETALTGMQSGCKDGDNELYRTNAHALKGTSMNLGAHALAELCKKAQETYMASVSQREALLAEINGEYSVVKKLLLQQVA